MKISKLVQTQRDFFHTHQTFDIAFRIEMLKKLRQAIIKYEAAFMQP